MSAKPMVEIHDTIFNNIDTIINDDILKGYPGAVLQVLHKGTIVKKSAYGYKNRYDEKGKELNSPEPMQCDTLFDIASNTKIYATLLAIMTLCTSGKLNIDKPIKHYIHEYNHSTITARDLLTHASGYGPEIWFFDPNNTHGRDFYSLDKTYTEKLLIEKIPLDYETGTKSVYSDTGFMVLGILIERISGKKIEDYLAKTIYNPLGLKNTLFNPLKKGISRSNIAATSFGNSCNNTMNYPEIRNTVIRGDVQDEKAYYSMGGVAGHAGLFSTADDIYCLTHLILNNGTLNHTKLIDPIIIKTFMEASDNDISFGCGWRRYGSGLLEKNCGNYVSKSAIGHTGFTGTIVIIDPYFDLSIVFLTNKVHTHCINRQDYKGNYYPTGKYAPIISGVYKALNLVK